MRGLDLLQRGAVLRRRWNEALEAEEMQQLCHLSSSFGTYRERTGAASIPPHYLQPIPLLHPTTQEILAKLSILAPVLQDQLLDAGYRKARAANIPEPTAEGEWGLE